MNYFSKKIINFLPFLSVVALILLWEVTARRFPDFVPSIGLTAGRFVELFHTPVSKTTLFGHIRASLNRVLAAFILAMISGVTIGVLCGWNKKIKAFVWPVFEILRPIPPIAWIPLVILWFGVGEFPKIFLVFIGSFIPIVLNTYTGITLVSELYLTVGRSFRASNVQLLFHIALPASIPAIFAGIKVAMSSSWMIVVAAEMIASKSGVGFLISRGSESYDVPLIVCGMILIGIVGAFLAFSLSFIEKRIGRWQTTE